jgi:hypothetical protein
MSELTNGILGRTKVECFHRLYEWCQFRVAKPGAQLDNHRFDVVRIVPAKGLLRP